MKKIAELSIFIISLFTFSFVNAQEDKISLTITPPLIKVSLIPGQNWTSSLKIVNNNPKEITVFVSTRDFKSGKEGGVVFISEEKKEENKKIFLSQWIEIPKEPITIPPLESRQIPFTIRVPLEAEPGGKYAAILVGTQPPPESGGTTISVVPLVSSLILANIRGNVREELWIREFSTEKNVYQQPEVKFNLKIENIGNVHLQPQGEIKILNLFGKERGVIVFNQNTEYGNILPQSSRKWTFSWRGEKSLTEIGRFSAILTLVYGNEIKQTQTRTIYFWIVPMKEIGLVAVSILLFLLLLFLLLRIYVKKTIKQILKEGQKEKIIISPPSSQKIADVRRAGKEKLTFSIPPKPLPKKKKYFLGIMFFIISFSFLLYFKSALKERKNFEVTTQQDSGTISPETVVKKIEEEKPLGEKRQEEIKKETLEIDKKSFSLVVLNGSGFKGRASEVAERLIKEGFQIKKIGNAEHFNYLKTVIKYKKEKEKEAEFLKSFLKSFQIEAEIIKIENQAEDIILIIGKDFKI